MGDEAMNEKLHDRCMKLFGKQAMSCGFASQFFALLALSVKASPSLPQRVKAAEHLAAVASS
jgi:hypothetical protein